MYSCIFVCLFTFLFQYLPYSPITPQRSILTLHETAMQPRPQILDLASRLNGASSYWGAAQTLQKWISIQPWRCLLQDLAQDMHIMIVKTFKIKAGCQNFQDLSQGVHCNKPKFQDWSQDVHSDGQNFEISLERFLRTEASRDLFSQRSISPPLRSKYFDLKFTYVTQTTWIVPRHQLDDSFMCHDSTLSSGLGWLPRMEPRPERGGTRHAAAPWGYNHILGNWRNGKDDWTNSA